MIRVIILVQGVLSSSWPGTEPFSFGYSWSRLCGPRRRGRRPGETARKGRSMTTTSTNACPARSATSSPTRPYVPSATRTGVCYHENSKRCYCQWHIVSWEPKGRYHYCCAMHSTLLVLNGTSLNIDSALLALNLRHNGYSYIVFESIWKKNIILFTPTSILLIPPSHLFRISRNQAEPAGMKNFQNSRHIREGISNPVTLEAEWAGMTAEWKFFIHIPRYAIRRCSELRPDSFEAHSGHYGRIWSGLPCRFSFEGDQNVSNAVGMP